MQNAKMGENGRWMADCYFLACEYQVYCNLYYHSQLYSLCLAAQQPSSMQHHKPYTPEQGPDLWLDEDEEPLLSSGNYRRLVRDLTSLSIYTCTCTNLLHSVHEGSAELDLYTCVYLSVT